MSIQSSVFSVSENPPTNRRPTRYSVAKLSGPVLDVARVHAQRATGLGWKRIIRLFRYAANARKLVHRWRDRVRVPDLQEAV